jgi:TIR domain
VPNRPKSSPGGSDDGATRSVVFISHDGRDVALAEAFSDLLVDASASMVSTFMSSNRRGTFGIEFGAEWYSTVAHTVENAALVIALITPLSLERPWMLFEVGLAQGRSRRPALAIAVGVPLSSITCPFAQMQIASDDENSLTKVVVHILRTLLSASPREQGVRAMVQRFRAETATLRAESFTPTIRPPGPVTAEHTAVHGPHHWPFSIFGEPIRGDWPDIFVLMPFDDDLRPVFDDHIKPASASLGLNAQRADDFFSTETVAREIWSAIYFAQLIVADCTRRNPNVFYEIGLAHALGRRTILIAQSIDDVPFDLRHLRILKYQYTPRGMQDFEGRYKKTIEAALKASET